MYGDYRRPALHSLLALAAWSGLTGQAFAASNSGQAFAASNQEIWLTRTRDGLDADGNSAYDRIEIFPDGRVLHETASLGAPLPGGCAPGGGRFSGSISAEDAKTIASLAGAAVKSQPQGKPDEEGSRVREIRQSLQFVTSRDGAPSSNASIEIVRATPELEALDRALAKISTGLGPTAAVSLGTQLTRTGNLLVRFVAPGKDAISLLFPANPEEAFELANRTLGYSKPVRDRVITLGPSLRTFEIEFTVKPKPLKGDILSYSTSGIRHHSPGTPELFLCTRVQ